MDIEAEYVRASRFQAQPCFVRDSFGSPGWFFLKTERTGLANSTTIGIA